jgi:polyphosphate glucokinase
MISNVPKHAFLHDVVTLSVDVGGSGIKAALLDTDGNMISERVRFETPYPCTPEVLLGEIGKIAEALPGFGRATVGFPGLVRDGRVFNIPSFSKKTLEGEVDPALVKIWHEFNLEGVLNKQFDAPVRVANDADVQGCAVISGKGLEFVMTLGTGCGTAMFFDGHLLPHLELGHAPFRKGDTFEQQIGNAARREAGKERWIQRVAKAIEAFDQFMFFDHIYIGGGNARLLDDYDFGPKVTIVENTAGILGGIAIWERD